MALYNKDVTDTLVPDAEQLAMPLEVTLRKLSGLSQAGALVIVPKELISTMSYAGQVNSLDQNLFSEGSALAAFLQLDATEQKRLESGWGKLREQIRDLEAKTARFDEKSDGSLEIVLPDLNSRIKAFGDDFRAQAVETIGHNRAEVLIAAAQVAQVVDDLGSSRKLTVHAEETGDGGWRYHTVVESSQGKRTYVGENLPAELHHIAGSLEIEPFENDKE